MWMLPLVLLLLVSLAPVAMAGALCLLWARRPRTDVPGPPTLPLIGNAHLFWRLPVLMETFSQLRARYGNTFRVYVGPKLLIFVTEPEDVQRVLMAKTLTHRDNFFVNAVTAFVGDGLLTTGGRQWRQHRRAVMPAFRTEALKSFMASFNQNAVRVCERLAATAGAETEPFPELFLGSLDLGLSNFAGTTLDTVEPCPTRRAAFVSAMTRAMEIMQERIFQPWLQLGWVLALTRAGRDQGQVVRLISSVMSTLTTPLFAADSAADHEPSKASPQQEDESLKEDPLAAGQTPLVAALTRSLRAHTLSHQEVFDEMRTLVVSGTDTTANTAVSALALLSLNQQWQSAAHQELDQVFGRGSRDYHREVTVEDIAQLKVLDRILKETMRLFPVIFALPRALDEEVRLSGGRLLAPRGSSVVVVPYLTHRLALHFPRPHHFDPDRFLGAERHPYSYVPFGAGRRNCPGGRYALLLMSALLATLLRRFQVLPVSSRQELERISVSVVQRPLRAVRLRFLPRT
ncbi:cytochrome P450 4g15-like [Schistocerca serialis cubense]|uniref:cytochrome P450 4g15-like n=1 Tax=Schistocerca serialis cubense TaxID=2023355 RepID=UPI00214EEF4E|nr:cytochrome P450 4g15-like [Schistocerca serialis cubense]